MKYHIRRKEKEITDHQILRRILKETKYVTIAMVKDNEPYLVSMSHGYDEKNHCLYLHSANEGKKLDYLRTNMNIWGQATIDYGYHVNQCSHLYASVQFKGKVTFIEDLDNKKHAFKTMMLQLEPEPEQIINRLLKSEGILTTTVWRIDLEYISGKKSEEISL
ncbi:MAG: pyridoxamine 5'-phosphate oxidase family protein [Promethearchaeota archaeon]|jgi:nitroimidazol reductase NimA-like FMN-containing flavoprotein (pyridoxamine 5'-phosphate oxidase superfamily)